MQKFEESRNASSIEEKPGLPVDNAEPDAHSLHLADDSALVVAVGAEAGI